MAVRVKKSIDVKSISRRILLEHLQSLGVILDFNHIAANKLKRMVGRGWEWG
jgi:hypothetical protein